MNHKQKRHLANSLMRPEDFRDKVPIFQSRGWEEYKQQVAKKAAKQQKKSHPSPIKEEA